MKAIHQLQDRKVRQRLRYFFLIVLLMLCVSTFSLDVNVREGKEYIDSKQVALYILRYNDVPDNYVSKDVGVAAGETDVTVYEPFLNTEGRLPADTYIAVYINATTSSVGKERYVFSDDTLYYTNNHYLTFSEVTEGDILGGHYMFIVLTIIFFIGGITVVVIALLSKTFTVKDIIEDIQCDYRIVKEKIGVLREKSKEQIKRLKKEPDLEE